MESKKKKIIKTGVLIACLFVICVGITYAFITFTLEGTKKVTISVGTLDLVLEEENAITISDALPISDQVGMIQEDVFEFRLVNKTLNSTDYVLKLAKIDSANELDPAIVKYYFTKNGVGTPALLSTLPSDGTVDSGTIGGADVIHYSLRLWIDFDVNKNSQIAGKSLSYMVKVEVGQSANVEQAVTIAGINEELEESTPIMFSYSNQGCIANDTFTSNVCDSDYVPMNGLYELSDDDGVSYYYRGNVDNLVKFGEYTKDYYVYRYVDGDNTYDFVSLSACQFKYSDCSEGNKVLKYNAGTPMYWRIVRFNGDKTIRMIYAGTSANAVGYETGIGLSRYNELHNDIKYSGYTYDRTTTEVSSHAKIELETWYNSYLSSYDNKIATAKFCSDTSGEMDAVIPLMGGAVRTFASVQRNFPFFFSTSEAAAPSFKCPATTATYGGSYSLKVGLITMDEMIAAGGQIAYNDSYYLYNGNPGTYDGKYFWTMTPTGFGANYADMGVVHDAGNFNSYDVDYQYGLLRPVINLNSTVRFKSGTEGSVTNPYELEQ